MRELASALEHALVWAGDRDTLDVADFPTSDDAASSLDEQTPLRTESERLALVRALSESHGNSSATARRLGISRGTLYRMLERHRVDPK